MIPRVGTDIPTGDPGRDRLFSSVSNLIQLDPFEKWRLDNDGKGFPTIVPLDVKFYPERCTLVAFGDGSFNRLKLGSLGVVETC